MYIATVAGILLLVGGIVASKPTAQPTLGIPATVEIYFSPQGGCEQAVCSAIKSAKKTICVMAYSFTSKPIAAELAAAVKRGVVVEVVADAHQSKGVGSVVAELAAAGCSVKLDKNHPIFHDKVMIVDQTTVTTGSFNFTAVAERANAENLLVIQSPEVCKAYQKNFEVHWQHAQPLLKINAENM